MANRKRLTWKRSLGGHDDVGLREGVTAGEAICKLADLEERKTIPLLKRKFPDIDEVYRVIAGHSNYHGDDILAALTCIAEGKKVKPIRPLPTVDVVEVVRCKDCKHMSECRGETLCDNPMGIFGRNTADDFCSHGERREGE